MNLFVKNLVGVMIIVGIPIYVGATLFSSYYARAVNPASFRQFNVSATGNADVTPNIAIIQLSVLTEGDTKIAELQKTNTDKMNKVIEFVKSKGVGEQDITTANYSISPRYQYFDCRATPVSLPSILLPDGSGSIPPTEAMSDVSSTTKTCPPPEIVGYSISQAATVKIRDFNGIGDLLSGATAQGANSISGPNFTIDDPAFSQKEARDQAISRAKEKAQSMAQAAGFSLGRLLSISEYATNSPYSGMEYGKGGMSDAVSMAAPAPAIQAGTQRVTIEVSLNYEIK
ncbi:MAG: SIMPL domain-containing protein [bacterium]|nr:SIMPL domain-containing protein [bacterium]